MKLSDFDYPVEKASIAQTPIENRDQSRLLVYDKTSGEILHRTFSDLLGFLKPEDLLILNDTKVNPARLYGKKGSNGNEVECLFISETEPGCWKTFTRGKLSLGETLDFGLGFVGRVTNKSEDGKTRIQFLGNTTKISNLFRKKGAVPLPPYIRRKPNSDDPERYQTVYARHEGSVAAPTAGLHFSQSILDQIQLKGIGIAYVTLHIGPGTFKPIRVTSVEEHQMEEEIFRVERSVFQQMKETKARGGRVIAVGTSSTRVIESLPIDGGDQDYEGSTSLFIYPGYRFRWLDGFLTNFHLPRSTPYLLTSAFVGLEPLRQLYQNAIENGYRFYSYGDAMVVL